MVAAIAKTVIAEATRVEAPQTTLSVTVAETGLSHASLVTQVLAISAGAVAQFIPSPQPLSALSASHVFDAGAKQVVFTSSPVAFLLHSVVATHLFILLAGAVIQLNPSAHPVPLDESHVAPTLLQVAVISFVFTPQAATGTHRFL